MAKDVREVLTDCTLCYHSCGAKIRVETNRGQVAVSASVSERVAEGWCSSRMGDQARPTPTC